MPSFKDKTGKIFGSLTVLSRAENKGKHIYWNCICNCGKEVCVRGDRLTESQIDGKGSPSCGHIRIQRVKEATIKDLSGLKIGKLSVLEMTEKRTDNGSVIWKCLCECGNIAYVSSDCLTKQDKPTRSCGCLQKEKAAQCLKSLSKEKSPVIGTYEKDFFVLDAELREDKNKNNKMWIYAKCPFCETKKWFQLSYIRCGDTKSCGCISKSAGEEKIEQLLIKNKIPYEREFRFNDCRDSLPLPFDFYINKKYLIEYDGQQHFQVANFGNFSKEKAQKNFEKTQKHDSIKNSYCIKNNIPLIRIPYTSYNDLCLNDLLLETSHFIYKQGENNNN